MSNKQPQTVPPRLDGHSYQPGFGLYGSRCKVELPPGIQVGSFDWDEWKRTLPPESFETILPQSMAGLLEWLRYHRDTVAILMTVRRRAQPDIDENAPHPDAFKQAAAVVVDGISWLNHFAGEVVIEPRCLTKPDANAVGQLEDLIGVVNQRLAMKTEPTRSTSRDDSPDEIEIAMARQVCRANPRITRDDLATQLEIGNTKASLLLNMMQDEGVATSKKRKPTRDASR